MQKIFDHKKAIINYNVEGNNMPVIILLHGFGEDAEVWNEQVIFLKDYFKLIVPDLPGSGLSVFKNENDDGDSIDFFADIINELLEHESISKCVMLGHSMGGYITLAFAEKFKEKLLGFGLIHSTAFADSDEKKINRLKGISVMEEYGGYAFLRNTTPNLFASKFKTAQPEKLEQLIEKGKTFSTKALQQYYKAMMNRPDRRNILTDNDLPVLFVMGTDDVAAPMEDVLKQTHLPNISFINILEHTGHMGMWENTEKVNNAILKFIESLHYAE